MKESLDVGFKGMRFQDEAGTVVTQPTSGSIKFKEGREKALSLESPRVREAGFRGENQILGKAREQRRLY